MPRPLTLLRNATLYDPEARGVVDLLVGAGSVLAVGASLDALPAALGHGRFRGRARGAGPLHPHVHLTGGGGESGPSSRVPRVERARSSARASPPASACSAPTGPPARWRGSVATTLALREEGALRDGRDWQLRGARRHAHGLAAPRRGVRRSRARRRRDRHQRSPLVTADARGASRGSRPTATSQAS